MSFTKSLERLLHFIRKIRTLTMLKGNNPTTPVQLVNTEAGERPDATTICHTSIKHYPNLVSHIKLY